MNFRNILALLAFIGIIPALWILEGYINDVTYYPVFEQALIYKLKEWRKVKGRRTDG
jgi:hypothetical protein